MQQQWKDNSGRAGAEAESEPAGDKPLSDQAHGGRTCGKNQYTASVLVSRDFGRFGIFGEEQWKCAETGLSRETVEPAAVSVSSVFSSMVGYAGSQRQTVEMCMAAVNYPPDGLPMLLTGESGVGKVL